MQYSWERVGDSLPDNARLQDFNRVLMITNIQFINAGEYKCNVRLQRDSGQDSASVVVPVECKCDILCEWYGSPLKKWFV